MVPGCRLHVVPQRFNPADINSIEPGTGLSYLCKFSFHLPNLYSRIPQYCIQVAACSATQLLPMNPDLPADLFTACLTTPIKVALRWFVMQNSGELAPAVNLDQLEKIPGQFGDRRTMLGELNWIFTDTIAWNTLPRDQNGGSGRLYPFFQKLPKNEAHGHRGEQAKFKICHCSLN